jgi:hypothetical protein
MQTIERDIVLPVDRETLRDFIATLQNLNDITPADLHCCVPFGLLRRTSLAD